MASLRELETTWTLEDIVLANDALDLQDEADRRAMTPPEHRS